MPHGMNVSALLAFYIYQICLLLGKFAEVSDPTVGVDFFARLVQVTPFLIFILSDPSKTNVVGSALHWFRTQFPDSQS
jgi:hypothetical protein